MITLSSSSDTIVACATPQGRGGIGIIRISGNKALNIAKEISGKIPEPRYAVFTSFRDSDHSEIDQGIILYFPAPHSFTGEDVIEFQVHGSPIVIDELIRRMVDLGARPARPGEFSERAFLNNKLDLAQAEAIADLIDASSQQAARAAIRSLQGEFSKKINALSESIIYLRTFIEAAIDFAEEEIEFLQTEKINKKVFDLLTQIEDLQKTAYQGSLLREGMTLVIAGKPNAGKSSLLNALSQRESAIVTDIPGTTRDILREEISIDGLPLHIIDTAGLRTSDDKIEQEGIKRALMEIKKADRILYIIDAQKESDLESELQELLTSDLFLNNTSLPPLTIIKNKIDLTTEKPGISEEGENEILSLSVKTGEGILQLREYLKKIIGYHTQPEGNFIARRRHLDALSRAHDEIQKGYTQLNHHNASELLAENLRRAHLFLCEITGEFSNEDLLGEIFSSFCIGK